LFESLPYGEIGGRLLFLHPILKDGIVKILSVDATTANVSVDAAISSTTTSVTIKNLIVTNERRRVIDTLKNFCINGPLFRNISEIYYCLKMAEYLY
jgi:hypothetical protein